MQWYVEVFITSLGESVLFAGGCAVAALLGLLILRIPFFDGLGLVLLIVSAGLMLIGGALSFVSPGNVKVVNAFTRAKLNPGPEDFRKAKHRAALYSMTGILLFIYSLLLAVIFA
jgi:hypothetical protein